MAGLAPGSADRTVVQGPVINLPVRDNQRVPVRMHLLDVPDDIELRVGTTASVLIMTDSKDISGIAPVPGALH